MATLNRAIFLAGIITTATGAFAQEKQNFYLPSTPAPDKKSESEKPRPTPRVTPKPTATPRPSPQPTTTPRPSPPPRSASQQSSSAPPFRPALDPYGLASAFQHRWDFASFLITTEEELRYRLDAARRRTLRIARAFSALSSEVEIRQRNLNAAALAAYLLSRDQATWSPVGGRNLTEAQMLAVSATMRQDMAAMNQALSDYETLRSSLNDSAEYVADLEKRGLAASPRNAMAELDIPMLPLAQVAQAQTDSVLAEHLLTVETLQAILATERLSTQGDERQSIASFAPPPPSAALNESPPVTTSLPPGGIAPPANLPNNVTMTRPEQKALIFPAEINAPVHAVRKGVVAYAGPFRGFGGMVILEHEKGTFSVYSHLGSIQVRERETVEDGTILGRAGTPPELGRSGIHFQVRRGKDIVNADEWLAGADVRQLLSRRP